MVGFQVLFKGSSLFCSILNMTVKHINSVKNKISLNVFSVFSLLCILPLSVMADGQGLLFIDVIAVTRDGDNFIDMQEDNDILPRAALFYANDLGNIRILGEAVIEDNEKRLGRFKIGLESSKSNILWIGRTHNPSSYWRDQFHHGGWLQPTINRPGITDFEFSGGVLPVISTGATYEGGSAVNNYGGLSYVINFGITSILSANGLEAPRLSEIDFDIHSSSFSTRLSYKFDSYNGGDELGIFGSNNHIANKSNIGDEFEQLVFGMFINWNVSDLKITSEWYSVTNKTINNPTVAVVTEDFHNAYIMLDYILDDSWNAYTRHENTTEEKNNLYLSNFPTFVIKRSLLGARYSISRNQTLKFEIEKNKLLSGGEYSQVAVQWNFVYP